MAEIRWRMHIPDDPENVYPRLSTDEGRVSFWVEKSEQNGDLVRMTFPNGYIWEAKVLVDEPPRRFSLRYIGGSRATFSLENADDGCIITLEDKDVDPAYEAEVKAGWVSVLMNLKSVSSFGKDLRNHNPERTWDQGFLDN